MSQRANLIKCRGLLTSGSEINLPEGSLRQATNVNVDEDGVITPRRGFSEYGNATDLIESARVKQLFEYKDRLFRYFDTSLEYEDAQGQFQSITGIFNELRDGYRLKYQEAKGNMYFTTSEGIKRISLKTVPNGVVKVEQAGVPKAAYMEGTAVSEVGGFLDPQSKVGYKFIFGKKDSNNNLLLGSASARHVISNTSIRAVVPEVKTLTIATFGGITDKEYIVIPTKSSKYTFYFKTGATAITAPLNSNTFGTTFVLVDINGVLNNADAAAVLANEIVINIPEYEVGLVSNVLTLTSTEEGNIDSIITDISVADLTVSEANGTVTEGDQANTSLTLIIPSTIDTDYFVQLYRTAPITASEGLVLDDIDPGEEFNLVYETSVTSTQITAGQMVIDDTTPESFRASGTPLYSNEITGQGILQSNDPPPIALDMTLFRNSMFYANTKGAHRLEFNIISVDDYEQDKTRLIISNDTITRIYTASNAESLTPEGGDFILSSSPSAGIQIDSTSRSLVKIINKDPDSPVNAYYLTGSDDLPGKILLEARSLIDSEFYFSIESGYDEFVAGNYLVDDRVSYLGNDYLCIANTAGEIPTNVSFWKEIKLNEEFSPEIDTSRAMVRLYGYTVGLESFAAIQLDTHGITTGEEVFVGFISDGDVDAPISFSGVFTATVIDVDNFYINKPLATSFDSDDITNGFLVDFSTVFYPNTKSDNLEVPNRLYFSKQSEPEAVPATNYIDVGAQDEEIKRILALRDNLFVLKDDGVFIVSGSSAPDFSVRLLDNTAILAPDSAAVLNNQIFALTEQGITMITDSGAGIISSGIDNLIDEVVNSNYNWEKHTFGIPYENDRAYIMFAPSSEDDTSATQAFRYNVFERTWSRWGYPANCGIVTARDNRLYLGNGERNFVTQERKDFDYNDHADRDFVVSITSNGVDGTEIKVSSTADLEISDVITQTQDVTISYLNNRILSRIDTFDTGLVPPIGETFLEAFGAIYGANMRDQLQAFNDYMETLDPIFTNKTFTLNNLATQMSLLIDELNNVSAPSLLKDYKKPETITYETYIVSTDLPNNIVYVKTERPFLEQPIRVYKHINKVVEWNPQHFGDPSAVKQVREATIMFDQNNFNEAFAKFSSDVEPALTTVQFSGKGKGYWGDLPWGDANHYWGGDGNDIPFRTLVPRGKQKCRYLTMVFEHNNAREYFRILGISGVVRVISSRGYR